MPSLMLRALPAPLMARLRDRASAHGWPLRQTVLHLLWIGLDLDPIEQQSNTVTVTADDIRAIRSLLQESVTAFGARWGRSGRTVEDWELGRTSPDPIIQRSMRTLI